LFNFVSKGIYQKDFITEWHGKCETVKIPLQQGENTKTIPKTKCYPYREIVGSLLYASSKTRPDIAFAVNYVSRSVEEPTEKKIKNVKHILKYLNSNLNKGIKYGKNENVNLLQAYSNADFAGNIDTRKSTTGYIIFLAGGPISSGVQGNSL